MAKLVSKTYGDAFFAAVSESGRLDDAFEAAKLVVAVLQEHKDFCKLLAHPQMRGEEKQKMLADTFGERIPDELLRLLVLLVEKGHTDQMIPVCEYFIALVKEAKGIGEVYVSSALELNELQKAKIEQRLLETTGYKSLEMQYAVEAELLGGVVIRIGDRVVDSSVRTKLQNLSRDLRK
ncbi:MAG: ATP synthase F1 subunit delta [Faecalimonas sp.]|nr:ATP synthase F1 subunit delta [Faecalimonas sp.]